MADTFIQANADGSGKKLHTFNRTIGANDVHDEVMLNGEPYLATYVITTPSVLVATANDHILQIMAGSSLNVYVRRIYITQSVPATTAAHARWEIRRLTTAGTGGSVQAVSPYDTSDAAAGATSQTLPTAKGTEGAAIDGWISQYIQTVPVSGQGQANLIFDMRFDAMLRTKAIRIPAGTANGIAIKHVTAIATASVLITAVISEANF